MIKPPSTQGDYSLVWSGDPALNLPDVGDPERERVLAEMRDTGKWDDRIRDGEKPTIFHVRRLPLDARNYVMGERENSSEFDGRKLSDDETGYLFLRVALRSIENWSGPKVRIARVSEDSEITAATVESLNALGAVADAEGRNVGKSIVDELAFLVFSKEMSGLRPLS